MRIGAALHFREPADMARKLSANGSYASLAEVGFMFDANRFKWARRQMPRVMQILEENDIEAVSFHFPPIKMSSPDFYAVCRYFGRVAEQHEVPTVTIHPYRTRNPSVNEQQGLVAKLDKLHKMFPKVKFCVETFEFGDRVFDPDEIARYRLPMVLDVCHLPDEESKRLLAEYRHGIRTVHLSAKKDGKMHLPIGEDDGFCAEVAASLNGWDGNLILEYARKYRHRVPKDIEILQDLIR